MFKIIQSTKKIWDKLILIARFSIRDALDLGMLGDQFDNTATLFIGFASLVGFAWSDITCPVPNCPGIDLIRDEFTLLNNVLIHHRG